MEKYDFSGWATRNDLVCSDGRIIRKDAFKHNDGQKVPLVWNHDHNDPYRVVGHALLENREEGVYAYGSFNDTELGKTARIYVEHGDINQLSIYANQLKQQGANVLHGAIREVSLVLAGANPGAFIENVIQHSDDGDPVILEDEGVIFTGENITLYHADTDEKTKEDQTVAEETKKTDPNKVDDETDKSEDNETLADVFNTLSEKQKIAVYAMATDLIKKAKSEDGKNDDDKKTEEINHSEGGDDTMKTNVFDRETVDQKGVLTHADQETIIKMAKASNVGSFQAALSIYTEENETLAHGFETEALTALLPEPKNITPGAPEIVRPEQSWVMGVINKIHKSPYSRIRTRQADARIAELKAKGYQKKGDEKKLANTIKLIGRSFDPQTIYVKDQIHRDDIIDITDFDYVSYVWNLMKDNMYETLALAALVGDGRDDVDPDKIKEDHVRSIWNDDELYTIHRSIDLVKAKAELQGSNTSANFSDNYIYAEAVIMEALYAREQFKGSGRPDFYCTPHLVNVMLLARDLNGRRIYDSKADLAKALNVGEIIEIEQFEGKTRTDKAGKTHKLLGLFVNLADYQFGSTKGGEVTKFEDFDIDFNTHKYLMETRLSGALTKICSAIALEEPVADGE